MASHIKPLNSDVHRDLRDKANHDEIERTGEVFSDETVKEKGDKNKGIFRLQDGL